MHPIVFNTMASSMRYWINALIITTYSANKRVFNRALFLSYSPFPCSFLLSFSVPFSTNCYVPIYSLVNSFSLFFTLHSRLRTLSLHLTLSDYQSIVYTTTLPGSVENSRLINYFYLFVTHEDNEKFNITIRLFTPLFLNAWKHAAHFFFIGYPGE